MKKKKYGRSIGRKTVYGLIVLGIVMIIAVSGCVAFIYQRQTLDNFQDITSGYAKSAAEYIDGDYVKKYAHSENKKAFYNDPYYKEVQKYLDSIQNNTGLAYYYVFIPYENDMEYVWDSDTIHSADDLNHREEYMEGGKEFVEKTFRKNPKPGILVGYEEGIGQISCSFYPIFDSDHNLVALAGADTTMEQVKVRLLHFILAVMIPVLTVIIIAILAWYRYMKKKLIIPLHTLNSASKTMAQNLKEDVDVELDINTHDEIEELADSFEFMNTEIRDYIHQVENLTSEKERIGAELDIARNIQDGMLPQTFPPFPERSEFDLYASMKAAKEVGGDFYDYFLLDDDHLALVIADVSGKGVPAALTMMATKILIGNTALMHPTSPGKILEEVNKQVLDNNGADMFVTVWLGILEISTGTLTCANAGHEYPVIYREGKSFELFKDKHGLVLGAMPESKYSEYTVKLEKGDVIYVYTDGVPEATDNDDKQMGMDYMVDALNNMPSTDPETIINEMYNAIDDFIQGAEQFDDTTMLCLRIKG